MIFRTTIEDTTRKIKISCRVNENSSYWLRRDKGYNNIKRCQTTTFNKETEHYVYKQMCVCDGISSKHCWLPGEINKKLCEGAL